MSRASWTLTALTMTLLASASVTACGRSKPAPGALAPEVAAVEPDTMTNEERRARFPRAYDRREKGSGVIFFRDEIARSDVADLDDLFRKAPRIRALIPGRFALDPTATDCGAPLLFVDGERTPSSMWEANRNRVYLRDYVDLDEVEILEVHRSAELIDEIFLRRDVGPPMTENEALAPRGGNGGLRRVVSQNPSAASRCVRIVLIWTPSYQEPTA